MSYRQQPIALPEVNDYTVVSLYTPCHSALTLTKRNGRSKRGDRVYVRKSVAMCISSLLVLASTFMVNTASASPRIALVQNRGHNKAIRGTSKAQNESGHHFAQVRERVTYRVKKRKISVPFQTIRRETDLLYVGQRHVLRYGVKGVIQRTTAIRYINGRKVGQKILEKVIRHPITEVMLVGTRNRVGSMLSGRSESGFNVIKELTVVATEYVAGGITATGVPAQPGVIAVDPSVIPLGTKVYIPGIGVVRAEDTGGAIIGDRIDICVSSEATALQWGVRTIKIYEIE